MEILVHICCAPCFTYPHRRLVEEGHTVTGLFFNPNIQPASEFRRRLQALEAYRAETGLDVIYPEGPSSSEEWSMQCRQCYDLRLREAARTASDLGFDGFTTSLLSSPWQRHALIKKSAGELARRFGVDFHYQDFRQGWQETVRISREMGLYRQKYCGCIRSLWESGYFRGEREAARKRLLEEFEGKGSRG
ncbi:MAG: epoxyqueuosine reductase QueH [Euryarchaeota archaeon]|nr:epoxyqueuosine reductase QueH [Euryarchaeota archaeon]